MNGMAKTIIETIITMVVVCFIIFALLFVFIFIICGQIFKPYEVKRDGYFQYIIIGEQSRFPIQGSEAVVVIVGFTASGLEQEVIEIPREIDGKPVQRIGFQDRLMLDDYYVYSENLRKMYIHDNIRYIDFFEEQFKQEGEMNESHVDIMICSMNDDFYIGPYSSYRKIYFYGSMIDEIDINRPISPANIVFMNNYSEEENEGYYRLDNIESGETIPEPPVPGRTGHEFTGWYTEAECVNKWNFDTPPVIEEGEEFRLYAGWQVA